MQLFVQQTFDQLLDDPLARPLRETTFVVVDLETTGGPPDGCGITEIGAVKIRGGAELAEFATLVNPGQPVPPFITVLTGITEAMLLPAPPLAEVLPAFLEFARDSVWVAHNAPYDIGFLRAACGRSCFQWKVTVLSAGFFRRSTNLPLDRTSKPSATVTTSSVVCRWFGWSRQGNQ